MHFVVYFSKRKIDDIPLQKPWRNSFIPIHSLTRAERPTAHSPPCFHLGTTLFLQPSLFRQGGKRHIGQEALSVLPENTSHYTNISGFY